MVNQGEPEAILFTDGACSGNPGPGGWAYILRDAASGEQAKAAGDEPMTTNNRMELQAVIAGLESLASSTRVRVVTDSAYVANGLKDWMPKWKANGWRRREGGRLKPVKNVELWQRLDELLTEHAVECKRVAGHAGHPENEECDRMAVDAYQKHL